MGSKKFDAPVLFILMVPDVSILSINVVNFGAVPPVFPDIEYTVFNLGLNSMGIGEKINACESDVIVTSIIAFSVRLTILPIL